MVGRGRDQADALGRVTHLGDHGVDLVAGQLPAFAGLRALRHLDLHHVGIDEIFRRHAEAARSDLLDRRAHRVAVGQRLEAVGLLAAFAGVRLAADAVHRDRQGRVGLARDRAERHRAGREAPDDRNRRLDLVERNRLAAVLLGAADAEQAADGQQVLILLVEQRRIGVVLVARIAAHSVLQQRNGLRRPAMRLAAQAVGVFAADVERAAQHRRFAERLGVTASGFLGDLGEAGAFDAGRSAEEELVDQGARQADRVEDLRAAIGLIGRDAHLRHDLEQSLVDRLDVALDQLVGAHRLGQVLGHRDQGLEGEIGIDRFRAIAGETGEMVHLAHFASFDDEADRGAQTLADQVMMHRRGRQQGRDRDAVRPDHAVGKDDDVVAAEHRRLGAFAQAPQRLGHALAAVGDVIGDVERLGVERILEMADAANLLQVLVGEDRLAHFEPLAPRMSLEVEQVRPRADERDQAHDQFFADRVDRRVGDLGEVLLEVGVEKLRLVAERRDRRVGPHRTDRFLARHRHRRHQEGEVLLRIAERLLPVEQRHVGARGARLDRVEVFEHDLGRLEPFPVRVGARQLALDLVVGNDAAFDEVDEQHLARLQPPLGDDRLLGNRQHAHFGSEHEQAVVGDEIARRPEAVTVERGADLAAVGEGHRRRTVPRLHHRGVVLVEVAPRLVHQRVAGPRLRDQHHHRMGERIAAAHQELERVVETGGVRLALVGDRPQLGDVGAEQLGIDARLARRHPVDVAAQRVDLAVVGDHAVGMGEPPGREGVGGEALVDERQRGFEPRILQVLVVARQLMDQHHALVDDGPARHRNGIIFGDAVAAERVDAVGNHLAQDVQPALERILVGQGGAAADEHLALHRLDRLHAFAEIGIVDRNVAPADQVAAFVGDRFGDDRLGAGARLRVARHEELADRIMAGLGQGEAQLGAFLGEEAVRDLGEHAAAVAERRVGAGCAAMVEIGEDLETLFEDCVRGAALHVGDDADAARIAFLGGVVKALGARQRRVDASRRRRGHRAGGLGVVGLGVHLSTPPRGRTAFRASFVKSILAGVGQVRRRRRPMAAKDSGGAFLPARREPVRRECSVRHHSAPRPGRPVKWSARLSYLVEP